MTTTKLQELTTQVLVRLHENVSDREALDRWKKEIFGLIDEIGEQKISVRSIEQPHSSLDPDDWLSARLTAFQTLDTCMNYIQYVRDRSVWQPVPDDIRLSIENDPLPQQGQSLATVYQDACRYIIPYARGSIHPRFWGWVSGGSTVGGVLADMIAATMNINACASTHSGAFVERTVIDWMRQIFNFPEETTGGLLVTGTSIATIISMGAARQRAMAKVREDGMRNGPQLIAYASTEVHVCVIKALELLGLGSKALHRIPVDDHFQIKIDHLKEAIRIDRENGLVPFCLIGNAGTVNTGAFDNLQELSSIARAENIWFHVDGAYGSLIILDPQRRHLVKGIDQADSLAFDFHKWLHCPYDAGCILIRHYQYLESNYAVKEAFLSQPLKTVTDKKHWCFNLGIEISRSLRALKVWFLLKEHGILKLGEKIAENCEQIQYLLSLLEKYESVIRIIRPVSLNIINFRFEPEEFDRNNQALLDRFNNQLLVDIHLSGVALPSSTRINGQFYIRVCNVNHRSTREDFDIFVDTLLKVYENRIRTFLQEIKLINQE